MLRSTKIFAWQKEKGVWNFPMSKKLMGMRLIGLPQNAPPPLRAKVKLVSSSESREQGHPLCDVRSDAQVCCGPIESNISWRRPPHIHLTSRITSTALLKSQTVIIVGPLKAKCNRWTPIAVLEDDLLTSRPVALKHQKKPWPCGVNLQNIIGPIYRTTVT